MSKGKKKEGCDLPVQEKLSEGVRHCRWVKRAQAAEGMQAVSRRRRRRRRC